MKFELYRFFVSPTQQQPLIPQKEKTKKEILSEAFSKKYNFEYQGSKLGYAFIRQEGDFIYARIGKKSHITKSLSPDENFSEETEDHWPYCNIYINLNDDPETGQVIAFEIRSSVFTAPINQLNALIQSINFRTLQHHGVMITVNPITLEQNFWDYVREYNGKIKELNLEFAPPNLFKLENELNDDLKDLQNEFGITSTQIILTNEEGHLKIPENNDLVKQGVEYITQGGGSYKLKIKNRVISSKQNVKTKSIILDVELEATSKAVFLHTLDTVFGSLKKIDD